MMKIHDFKGKKEQGRKISMLTCYDYPSACVLAESSVDCALVGDSVAMAVHGYDSTIMATIEMMAMHTRAVAKGLTHQFLISDLPFLCYQGSLDSTINHVKALMQAGAHAVKLEGASDSLCHTISELVSAGVPVMGHIGLTPQSIHQLGGHVVQGKAEAQATELLSQAQKLEAAGCFALVIECVPHHVATRITQALTIPTIGIGAGPNTDGQVLVWHDALGLQTEFKPRFIKHYVAGKALLLEGITRYVEEVQQATFPAIEHTFN